MKRGLKDNWVDVDSLSLSVALTAPMKRGLKDVARFHFHANWPELHLCPDEKGTETKKEGDVETMQNKAGVYAVVGCIAGAVLTIVVCSLSGCAAGSQPHPADDTEGAYAGMTYAEVNARIDRDMEELEADIERSLAWYAEIEKDSARIKEMLACSKAENDAVLADHPATPLLQRLIKEGYTDEEIFRNPEFKRIMNEYLGLSDDETEE